jgi:AraC-like DNA-binding protein
LAITIRAAALIGYADLAREIGLDPLRMLDRVGIPRAALADPDMRISAAALRDLWELCAETAEDWGIRLMDRRPLSVLGPLLLIVREQPTLRHAIAAVARYTALHHEAVSAEVDELQEVTIIRTIVRYEVPGPTRQIAETSVYQGLRLWRLFLGPTWQPLSVSFMHAPPVSLATHRRAFGPNLLFDQDFNGITLRRADLDARNEAADPEMERQIALYAEGLARPATANVAAQVRKSVEGLLRAGHCNTAVVAQQIGLDVRTLQRHLARSSASFHDILQEVRLDLAFQYLEESDRPLAEVAELLGFSALSAFSRWHRNHRGLSPSERREGARSRVAQDR